MATVRLELQDKNDNELRDFAELHITKMTGNANFPDPEPLPADFDPDAAAYRAKLAEIAVAEAALAALRSQKDALRVTVESNLTTRGRYVQNKSGGDPAIILSSGFEIQDERTTTTGLPQPQNLVARIGDNAGDVDLMCHAVKRAKSYIWQCREHIEGQPPGAWTQAKVSTRSSVTATGLISGRKYAFRVQALGPNETESPWSDEAVCMAA